MNLETIHYRIGELERLLREHTTQDNTNFEKLHAALLTVHLDIQALKTKAGVWGAAGGTVAAGVVSALAAYFFNLLYSLH